MSTAGPLIDVIAGARPNFMKIAPIVRALRADGRLDWRIVHTGQHYDRDMNDVFFDELGIPAPDVRLGCGGGSHATQTGRIMEAYESLCTTDRPDAVLVVGDVNSTLACSIVAAVAHKGFKALTGEALAGKLVPGGSFVDVKAAFDEAQLRAAGASVWRL